VVALGWALTALILVSYAASGPRPWVFHVANVVLCVPCAIVNLALGSPPAAGLNLAFGALAAVTLWRTDW
jgi:hypothetical protein